MKIRKVVVTAAGLGTRLLTATKEQPKEMLPLFSKNDDGSLCVKPVLQMVFEQLYDHGFREFCFVVGRGKRSIEDHFTVDWDFIEQLNRKGKQRLLLSLEQFYRKVENSFILWVNQPEPRGFGHAVLMSKPFVGDDPFLVYAGDTYIYSPLSESPIKRLVEAYGREGGDAVLLLKEIENPVHYGVAEVTPMGGEVLAVNRVVEKPARPPSNLAIMPIYAFTPRLIKALEETRSGLDGEVQITDAIQSLIEEGRKVIAIKLKREETRLDVGTPEFYWEALATSYRYSKED